MADSIQRVFDGITYNPSTNYMELINLAKEVGDLGSAAQYEAMRNAKIQGEGMTQHTTTYEFTEALQPATDALITDVQDVWKSFVMLSGVIGIFACMKGYRLKKGIEQQWAPFVYLLVFSYLALL